MGRPSAAVPAGGGPSSFACRPAARFGRRPAGRHGPSQVPTPPAPPLLDRQDRRRRNGRSRTM